MHHFMQHVYMLEKKKKSMVNYRLIENKILGSNKLSSRYIVLSASELKQVGMWRYRQKVVQIAVFMVQLQWLGGHFIPAFMLS